MTFDRARYNNAGYPVYKRKKSENDISSSDNQMTRRGFLKILGGAAATSANELPYLDSPTATCTNGVIGSTITLSPTWTGGVRPMQISIVDKD